MFSSQSPPLRTPPLHSSSRRASTMQRTLASSPLTSSPLAPPRSSPLDRVSVFKTAFHGRPATRQPLKRLSDNIDMGANLAFDPFRKARDDEPVKLLWRERLEQRCKDRVANDRRKSRDRERGLDTAADQDMEESEIDFLDDELIRRAVVADARRKQRDLELVYARDVGSSIDPDMEDVDALEREILAAAQEPDSEPSPPSSVLMDDDGDPGDLFDAYLAQLTEEERTSSLPPSSPPTIPSSPPPLSDDFDMDDWDTEFALDD